jgi:hypothetical protein
VIQGLHPKSLKNLISGFFTEAQRRRMNFQRRSACGARLAQTIVKFLRRGFFGMPLAKGSAALGHYAAVHLKAV